MSLPIYHASLFQTAAMPAGNVPGASYPTGPKDTDKLQLQQLFTLKDVSGVTAGQLPKYPALCVVPIRENPTAPRTTNSTLPFRPTVARTNAAVFFDSVC